MIRTIFKHMWNQRSQNVWIFFELLFVGIFLWVVLDPLCVQLANKNIENGYEQDGMYILKVSSYNKNTPQYNAEIDNDSISRLNYLDIIREINNMPEVESFFISLGNTYANSGGFSGTQLFADSAMTEYVHAQGYHVLPVDNSDILKTYRMRDVQTNEIMTIHPDFATRDLTYISESAAMKLFGRIDVVGEKCYQGRKWNAEIAGVFRDFKDREYNQPYPLIISSYNSNKFSQLWLDMIFRVKDNVDQEEFEKKFHTEIKPKLKRGNYYCTGIIRFDEQATMMSEIFGELNYTRKNSIFAIFGLLCVFLGMTGTFWVRANARRQEIGVMRSLGASKWRIASQFLTEAGILITITSIISTILIANYIYTEGFFSDGAGMTGNLEPNPIYWQNNPVSHFAIISFIVYLVLLATALIATYIPVSRATCELPADALREE